MTVTVTGRVARTAATAAVVTATVLGAAACSGPSSAQAAHQEHAPGSSPPASRTPSPTPAQAPRYRRLSARQINDVLLTEGDVPPGYAVAEDSASAEQHAVCGYRRPTKTSVASGTRSFTRAGGASQQFATVSITEYASSDAARESWEALEHALDSCHHETYRGTDRTYVPISTPPVGYASTGTRVIVTDPVLGDRVVVEEFALAGPCLVSASAGARTGNDTDEAAHLLARQVRSYQVAAR
jgi:hypothetical protein